ncbi:ABC transporter permease [Limibacillus sp. MBR-115]|jgi:peptide/nickel transport system permease protein|uniref:ABC transporter permease n=1 Tax=Limibacillus sp. MBR-115 TaxID=3156465 RepID=UPI003396167D
MSAVEDTALAAAHGVESRSKKLLRRYLLAFIGAAIVAFWALIILLGPAIAPYDYDAVELTQRLLPPSSAHLLGTDELGRDVLSRVIYGTRVSLPTGILVVLIGGTMGTVLGGIAGHIGGRLEELMMRVTDLFLCFPPLILAMAIAAALGVGWTNTIIAMVVVWWPKYARISRSLVIVQRSLEYVDAARMMGFGSSRIFLRHILPNTIGPLITLFTLDIGTAVITFAGLSFLGLGVVPPIPEWGAMVSEGRTLISQWWVSAFPGFAIFTVVMGFNFLGDGLRDWLDPRAKQR